jgi:thiosulfate/3-mercaptopyruvate sulfurtransferase
MMYSTLISPQECFKALENNPIILDCRFQLMDTDAGRRAYLISHLPSAQYVHLDKDCSGRIGPLTSRHPLPEMQTFLQRVAAWGITKESQVILYDDQGGSMAARTWWMLKNIGVEYSAILDGGFLVWQALNLPLTTEIVTPQLAPLLESKQNWQIVSTAQMQNMSRDPGYLIIDARSPERYAGLQEPIDFKAGHIPSAINRFHGLNFDQQGFFKTPDVLKKEFLELLGNYSPAQTVLYCGSGVTSCTHLLAMEVAGLPGARLYAGSWSEWIKYQENPVITENDIV